MNSIIPEGATLTNDGVKYNEKAFIKDCKRCEWKEVCNREECVKEIEGKVKEYTKIISKYEERRNECDLVINKYWCQRVRLRSKKR